MSFVFATPEYVEAAASDLARIGWTITSANSMAMGPTSSVLAPGADEVSTSIAALFGAHSQVYQALSAQAAAFHNQFVQLMNGGSMQYLATEAANTTPLQSAAAPASMAAQLPAATAAGGSAPGVPAAPDVGRRAGFGARGRPGTGKSDGGRGHHGTGRGRAGRHTGNAGADGHARLHPGRPAARDTDTGSGQFAGVGARPGRDTPAAASPRCRCRPARR